MTDLYMPDVKVEVAFDSGYTTPADDRTWTDVSDYVELEQGIEINFGRQDELSSADANTLQLTLDNSDGRFTAGRSASPYYPNVKVGRPIRVTTTPNGNHHPNGGLEDDDAGWYSNTLFGAWGTATMDRSTTRAHEGSASLLITWPTHATASLACANLPTDKIRAGVTYTASCWVWVPTGSPDPRIDLGFLTNGPRTSLKDQWVYLEKTFTATTSNHLVGIQVATPTAGQQCYVDEFMVNRGPTALPYTSELAAASTRFVGFVDEWPVEWDGTDTYARAPIRAASRLSRLGLGAKLRSAMEQEVLAAGPVGYWTFGDPSGSTQASESSGRGIIGPLVQRPRNPQLETPETLATFGQAIGVGSDGLTALAYPANGLPFVVRWQPAQIMRSMRIAFVPDAGDIGMFLGFTDGPGSGGWVPIHNGATSSPAYAMVDFLQSVGGTAAPGVLHDFVITESAADGQRLYLDGVQVATAAGTDYPINFLQIGYPTQSRGLTICHVALYDVILTPEQVARQAVAALTGFAGERTDSRLVRLLGWAGVPSSEVTVEEGVETMTYQLTGGMSVVDALRECESTEGGVLFDGRDGNVTFHNRSHRYTVAPLTLDMASQHVGSDYVPRVDRSTLANDVEIENPTTGEKVRRTDTDSSDEYGIATDTVTSVAESSAGFDERADWLLSSYAEPRPRVPSLTVDVLAHQGLTPSAQDLLELTMGDLLEVENAPTQSDTTTPSYFVEGYTERIGPETYELTFNLSPSSPTAMTLLLDSATRGLLDTNLAAY